MSRTFQISNRRIGSGCPTYIIAELSGNHNGDYNKAEELIRVAASAGADAVKMQTYTADTLTIDCDNVHFRDILKGTLWEGKKLYDLYKEAYTPWDWQPKLKQLANSLGLDWFSSPFDETAVDFLEKMEVPCYKVASFEMSDHILLRKIGATNKPVIMSVGMASIGDIEESITILRAAGCPSICILKCVSQYPAPYEDCNLRTIPHIAETFNVISGLSDHTLGTAVCVTAVALGAHVIEKHFCLSRNDPGPDSAFSLEPKELKQMIADVRAAEQAIGAVVYGGAKGESKLLRRSLFVVKSMKKGEQFTPENVRSIRPALGLHTRHWLEIEGKTAAQDIEYGTPLSWSIVQ
jgi:pseudaminic acid synthase